MGNKARFIAVYKATKKFVSMKMSEKEGGRAGYADGIAALMAKEQYNVQQNLVTNARFFIVIRTTC